jgi:hypothetical protein
MMSNPLDPIWDAHESAQSALNVVKRCVDVPGINRRKALSNTRFYGLPDVQCLELIVGARLELNDAAIFSLYGAFEARLREHMSRQAPLLHAAIRPAPEFGVALAVSFSEFCASNRMDDLVDLFSAIVGQQIIAQVGSIRAYRHWLAHGRAWKRPARLRPPFVYQTLTAFLVVAGLV